MISEVQRKILLQIIQILNKNNIRFEATGGLAAIAYGSERPLFDIDLDISRDDVEKVRSLFKEYVIEDFHHLENNHFDIYVMTINIEGVIIDFSQVEDCYVISKDGTKTKIGADLTKATTMEIEGINLPVEDKEELISYKKIIGRETDLIDVKQIS